MPTDLSELDAAAVNIIRRLLAGERVEAKPFLDIERLAESLSSVRRRGLVVKNGRILELTALGQALRPDLISLDARRARENREREAERQLTLRAKENARPLLYALEELIAASDAAELDSEDPAVSAAAHARNFAAYEAAEALLEKVKGEPQ